MTRDGGHGVPRDRARSNRAYQEHSPGYPCDDPRYPEMSRLVRSRECVAFIGSGPSTSEYPNWGDAVSQICTFCGLLPLTKGEKENEDILLDRVDEARKNEEKYCEALMQIFGKPIVRTPRAYDLLMDLGTFPNAVSTMSVEAPRRPVRHALLLPAGPHFYRRCTTFAVMSRAWSEHRNRITSATSSGSTTCKRSGRRFTCARTRSVTQPVSVTGG
jgi:hypothetical protein